MKLSICTCNLKKKVKSNVQAARFSHFQKDFRHWHSPPFSNIHLYVSSNSMHIYELDRLEPRTLIKFSGSPPFWYERSQSLLSISLLKRSGSYGFARATVGAQ